MHECRPCEYKWPLNRRCYDSDTYEVEICRCDGQGWDNWKRIDCPEGKKCCDPGGLCRECCTAADCDDDDDDCCTDDKCEDGVCQHIDITPEVCAGITCPEGEHCVCQCGSPVYVSDHPKFPLGLVLEILFIPVIIYMLWRNKQKRLTEQNPEDTNEYQTR